MRSVVCLAVLCAMAWLAPGCESSGKSAGGVATYQCSACKDTVTWEYGTGQKGIPTGQKVVTHTCTMCKKEWEAGISPSNQCAVCNAKEAKCPTCVAHGG